MKFIRIMIQSHYPNIENIFYKVKITNLFKYIKYFYYTNLSDILYLSL